MINIEIKVKQKSTGRDVRVFFFYANHTIAFSGQSTLLQANIPPTGLMKFIPNQYAIQFII